VRVRPAIVTVPVRLVVAVFAATAIPTVPLPLPVAPVEIAIHEAPLVALQAHPAAAVTATEYEPPAATGEADVGEIV